MLNLTQKRLPEQALLAAKAIADDLFITNQNNDRPIFLRTKIQGNLAALYITQKAYDVALDMHASALDLRLQLVKDSPSPRTKLLFSAAYKGIATVIFISPNSKINTGHCFYCSHLWRIIGFLWPYMKKYCLLTV